MISEQSIIHRTDHDMPDLDHADQWLGTYEVPGMYCRAYPTDHHAETCTYHTDHTTPDCDVHIDKPGLTP